MFFPRVPFGIISLWTAGIHKNSLQAGFSVEPPNCITVVHLQWSGHILFSLRVPSHTSLSNCSKYNSRFYLLC